MLAIAKPAAVAVEPRAAGSDNDVLPVLQVISFDGKIRSQRKQTRVFGVPQTSAFSVNTIGATSIVLENVYHATINAGV